MGYGHCYYAVPEFDANVFRRVVSDFQKLARPLERLCVRLAGECGKGRPTITDNQIVFNGIYACGHPDDNYWASLEGHEPEATEEDRMMARPVTSEGIEEPDSAMIEERKCLGMCSSDPFVLHRKVRKRRHMNEYNPEPLGEWMEIDGRRARIEPELVGKYFVSCATRYKPYDIAVNACLIIAKKHLGDDIIVYTDGDAACWSDGMQLCQHFLKYGMGFLIDSKGELLCVPASTKVHGNDGSSASPLLAP